MSTLVIDRRILPEQIMSFFSSPRIAVSKRRDGDVVFSPVIDPADYDNDTDYLNAIPGMAEKILAGRDVPSSECVSRAEIWNYV